MYNSLYQIEKFIKTVNLVRSKLIKIKVKQFLNGIRNKRIHIFRIRTMLIRNHVIKFYP